MLESGQGVVRKILTEKVIEIVVIENSSPEREIQ